MTVEELTSTVARYLGEERTRTSLESFAATHRISMEPKDEAEDTDDDVDADVAGETADVVEPEFDVEAFASSDLD